MFSWQKRKDMFLPVDNNHVRWPFCIIGAETRDWQERIAPGHTVTDSLIIRPNDQRVSTRGGVLSDYSSIAWGTLIGLESDQHPREQAVVHSVNDVHEFLNQIHYRENVPVNRTEAIGMRPRARFINARFGLMSVRRRNADGSSNDPDRTTRSRALPQPRA